MPMLGQGIGLVVASAAALFWLALALDPRRRWRRALRLEQAAGLASSEDRGSEVLGPGDPGSRIRGSQASCGGVLALVPARDEAKHLSKSLRALATQRCGCRLDLVLVDDASADATAEVATNVLAECDGDGSVARWRVVSLTEKPEGWSGKVHAQAAGLRWALAHWYARESEVGEAAAGAAKPEWLLLCDADIVLRQGALGDLLRTARQHERDMVSVMARLRCDGFWERLLIPPFVFFFQLLYPFSLVAEDRSRVAAAAGGCVLVRRAALERAGGFAAVADALIDDVGLAHAVQRAGGRLWLGIDAGVASIRAYPGLRSLWRMVARSAFVQLRYSWSLLAAVVLGMMLFFVVPPGLALLSLWRGAADGDATELVAGGLWSFSWLMQGVLLWPVVRHHRVGVWYSTTLWLASAFYAAMTVSSACSHLRGRTSVWKGRAYGR